MELTTLEIILILITAALVIVIVYAKVRQKKYLLRATRRIDDHFSSLLSKAESENRRINTLYNDLKKQVSESKNAVSSRKSANIIDIERLAAEQKNLEVQQHELSDRNRQLWNMSVSIEKERQHIQELKNEIEDQHYAVTSSIHYAKLIQNAVLPSEKILRESFQDVFLFWRPRDIVSGDFYWMKRIGDNVIFSVADCTGHGVPGAFMSMLGVAFLNEICVDFNADTNPAQILELLRKMVIETLEYDNNSISLRDGMDIGLCILNLATKKMQFAGANNGMYHVRGTELTEYKPVRNPIGSYPVFVHFENRDVDVMPGDYRYMFSDGYTDQLDASCHKFTPRRLRQLLCDINAKTKVAAEQAKILDEEFDKWRKDVPQIDDILIGGYCIK